MQTVLRRASCGAPVVFVGGVNFCLLAETTVVVKNMLLMPRVATRAGNTMFWGREMRDGKLDGVHRP